MGDERKGVCVQKYNTSINWTELNKLLNQSNGSYKFEYDSWRLLCYISDKDFDSHCKQLNITNALFYNFIILLELYKKNGLSKESIKFRNYFEEKYPGLFDLKKKEIEKLYDDYIQHLQTF
jgi:hypothetical protein